MSTPICVHCGAEMAKRRVAKSGCIGQFLGLALLIAGLVVCVLFFPIGILPGLVLLFLGAALSGSRKVLKCKGCGAVVRLS